MKQIAQMTKGSRFWVIHWAYKYLRVDYRHLQSSFQRWWNKERQKATAAWCIDCASCSVLIQLSRYLVIGLIIGEECSRAVISRDTVSAADGATGRNAIVSGLKRVCLPEGHRVGVGEYCDGDGAGVAQLIPLNATPVAWPPDTFVSSNVVVSPLAYSDAECLHVYIGIPLV